MPGVKIRLAGLPCIIYIQTSGFSYFNVCMVSTVSLPPSIVICSLQEALNFIFICMYEHIKLQFIMTIQPCYKAVTKETKNKEQINGTSFCFKCQQISTSKERSKNPTVHSFCFALKFNFFQRPSQLNLTSCIDSGTTEKRDESQECP